MMKSRISETQIVSNLGAADAGRSVHYRFKECGIGPSIYYQRKSNYGGLEASEPKSIKGIEAETPN